MGTPQDHTYYCMVHTLHPEPDPDVVHGRDNPSGSENYENFTLDKSNVKPPQSILGISSQTWTTKPQMANNDNYNNYFRWISLNITKRLVFT